MNERILSFEELEARTIGLVTVLDMPKGEDPVFTIRCVDTVEFDTQKFRLLRFHEVEKAMILSKTQEDILYHLLGQDWVGKKIKIGLDTVFSCHHSNLGQYYHEDGESYDGCVGVLRILAP